MIHWQARSFLDNDKDHQVSGIWYPDNGQSREEWLRCHGFSCKKWLATRRKLQEFKIITAKPDIKLLVSKFGFYNQLNANKTYFIIIGTSRQPSKLTRFFPTDILSHSITPSDIIRNLGVTSDNDFNFRKHISLTCRSCFYHIRELRRIRGYISFSVAKTIATALITSRLNY